MEEQMNTTELKILFQDMIRQIHAGNKTMAMELEKSRRIEMALRFLDDHNFLLPVQEKLQRKKIRRKSKKMREVSIHIDQSRCTVCGKCVDVCRQHVLSVVKTPMHKQIAITDPARCIGCLRCMNSCNHQAIAVTRYR